MRVILASVHEMRKQHIESIKIANPFTQGTSSPNGEVQGGTTQLRQVI